MSELDRIETFCDRAIPEGINPPGDLWMFVYTLRLKATEAWMEGVLPW